MVEVKPFKGITYNKDKIKNLNNVMSPPYDIISKELQDELYDKDPYNFVRLILGKQDDRDNESNNRYTRAKKLFDKMMKDSILKSSKSNSIYPYKIEYHENNNLKIMNGFFILLKLDPEYKLVKAHERTLSKPKADRLNLMRQCKANLEPIQLLYIDEMDTIRNQIDKNISDPIINVKGYDGFNHKLWKLDDKNVISNIVNFLKDNVLFIADGHHRYQTSVNYAAEMREKTGLDSESESFDYIMVILVNIFDKGLSILPTHRFIKKDDLDIKELLVKLKKYFDIEEKIIEKEGKDYSDISSEIKNCLKTKKEHKFIMYLKDKYYVLTLKDESIMDTIAEDHSKTWRILDVSILHKIILENLMDINQDNLEDHVTYTRVDEEAIRFVDEGKYDMSFLMNPTRIDELKAIADAGEHMPQKSTYFLPKMLSGLVMYKMD